MDSSGPANVLLVMRQPGNIRVMEQVLAAHQISVQGISSEAALQDMLVSDVECDLALVDVSGFGPSIWRMCASLQQRSVPFIVLFQPGEVELGSQSLHYGALSVLQKPVTKTALLQLIKSLAG